MSRDYSDFELPYTIPSFLIRWAVDKYIRPDWDLLSPELAQKVSDAYTAADSLTITEADLDGLSDDAWSVLKEKLGK